jgi:structural maintenance of chromosome 4
MEVDEETPPVPKGRRAAAKANGRSSSKATQQPDDEMDAMSPLSELEEDEDVKPTRKTKVPSARKAKVTTKKSTKAVVIEDSDDDLQAPPSAQPPAQPSRAANDAQVATNTTPEVEEEEEEEEEKSLFDPPPMPGPSILPQAIPEEPTGPKSRLVIHKMALVNFKSYAGRQEIGPFHKVINIRQFPTSKIDHSFDFCSRSLLSLVPMGQGNPIPLMLFYSYSVTAPRR